MRCSNAEGTCSNRCTSYAAYERFCGEYQLQLFPADDWQFCQFVQFLASEQKAPGTCDNYVSAICVLQRLQRHSAPEKGQIHYCMISDGMKCMWKEPVRQAEPMNHDILCTLFYQVDFSDELEVLTWVTVLVAFTLILRFLTLDQEHVTNLMCVRIFLDQV